ncbi:MAG: hypothetical protein WC480_02930 [Patescibacteria group bacterium]
MPICTNCQKEFVVLPKEKEFLDKHYLSIPKVCPFCRQVFRYASRNEYYLYLRRCSQCQKEIVSYISPDKPLVVYCSSCYWLDSWSGTDYGIDYNSSLSVFDHLKALHLKVPHLSGRIIQSQNSDYTNSSSHNKDCYLSFRVHYCEGVFNSYWIIESKDCSDCLKATKNELCYQCVDCHRNYNCQYCFNCYDSLDCSGCVDCRNCQACHLCSNLRNRRYCYQNKQLNRDEYERLVQPLYTYSQQQKFVCAWKEIIDQAIYSATNQINSVNCSGDNLLNCKDCYSAFDLVGCENCIYLLDALNIKDSVDVYSAGVGVGAENVYNSWGVGNKSSSIIASFDTQEGMSNAEYCQQCYSGHDLFGCVNLRNKSFCIFNKQYREDDYFKLKEKIVNRLKEEGIYGAFQPPEYSLFGYNESPAMGYLPLTKEEVLAKGWRWHDQEQKEYSESNYQIPDNIRQVSDEITKEALACTQCGRNYKIISSELDFYRKFNLPIPRQCFYCRHTEKINLRNPLSLHKVDCAQCGREVDTSFPTGTKKKIYCQECYQKEIY